MKWYKYLLLGAVIVLIMLFIVCIYTEITEQYNKMQESIAAQTLVIEKQNKEIENLRKELQKVETDAVIYEQVAQSVISGQW